MTYNIWCRVGSKPQFSRGVGGPGTAPGAISRDTARDSPSRTTTDTSSHTTNETTLGSASQTASETTRNSAPDTARDTGHDTGRYSGADVGADAPRDTGQHTPNDTAGDTRRDTARDTRHFPASYHAPCGREFAALGLRDPLTSLTLRDRRNEQGGSASAAESMDDPESRCPPEGRRAFGFKVTAEKAISASPGRPQGPCPRDFHAPELKSSGR